MFLLCCLYGLANSDALIIIFLWFGFFDYMLLSFWLFSKNRLLGFLWRLRCEIGGSEFFCLFFETLLKFENLLMHFSIFLCFFVHHFDLGLTIIIKFIIFFSMIFVLQINRLIFQKILDFFLHLLCIYHMTLIRSSLILFFSFIFPPSYSWSFLFLNSLFINLFLLFFRHFFSGQLKCFTQSAIFHFLQLLLSLERIWLNKFFLAIYILLTAIVSNFVDELLFFDLRFGLFAALVGVSLVVWIVLIFERIQFFLFDFLNKKLWNFAWPRIGFIFQFYYDNIPDAKCLSESLFQ